MTRDQFTLDLRHTVQVGEQDFLVAASNEDAYRQVLAWPDGSAPALILTGPAGAGKSHLASIWAARRGATVTVAEAVTVESVPVLLDASTALVIDPLREGADETALFHLLNAARERGCALLLVSSEAPALSPIRLPDLRSRLLACPVAKIAQADDALLRAVLVKLFTDRQLIVGPELIDYLLGRAERSFSAIRSLVADLDAAALARGRPITIALARTVLADSAGSPGPD